MKSKPGTYALVLRSLKNTSTQIGRRGRLRIVPGYYIYVGSAFGSGGVQARISRHCRKTKSKHWHIDYLLEEVDPIFAWYSNEPTNLEHRWARILSEMEEISPVKGFGCTDCKCLSHLFVMKKKPSLARFTRAINSPIETRVFQSES
ncbi:MAG: GIY-YIG nuclease family protein [Syntrophaceae bacterium]|nr:GIY-YIG nuclease family protein [Syntrophaceae bacterium]